MVLTLPYLYTMFIMIRWFRYDGPETRPSLPKAFCVSFFVQLVRGLWAIIGSFIIFGKLMDLYLIDTFDGYYAEQQEGITIEELKRQRTHYFLGSTIAYMVITLPLTFYYMGIAKRMRVFWQPMNIKGQY